MFQRYNRRRTPAKIGVGGQMKFFSYWTIYGIAICEWIIIIMLNQLEAGYLFFGTFWFPLMTSLFIINNLENKKQEDEGGN